MNEAAAQPRSKQPTAMRERLIDAAVELLINEGVAKTTTSAVQKKAGVSRGALLHHFPSRALLLASTVQRLVRQNEQQINESFLNLTTANSSVEEALIALSDNMAKPSYRAEMELWVISRNDPELRDALYQAEKAAKVDLDRVVGKLLSCWKGYEDYQLLADLSVEFIRGVAFSDILRNRPEYRYRMISLWTELIRKSLQQ